MGVVVLPLDTTTTSTTTSNDTTSELNAWIARMRRKRSALRRQPRADLLRETLLAGALTRAGAQLRRLQEARRQRWRHLREHLDTTTTATRDYRDSTTSAQRWYPQELDEKTEHDLRALDEFMAQIKEAHERRRHESPDPVS